MLLDATKPLPAVADDRGGDEQATASTTATKPSNLKVHNPPADGDVDAAATSDEWDVDVDGDDEPAREVQAEEPAVEVAAEATAEAPPEAAAEPSPMAGQEEEAAKPEPEAVTTSPASANNSQMKVIYRYLSDPQLDAINDHLKQIREKRKKVRKAKFALDIAKETVKELKADWEQEVLELGELIDDGPEELPLFDRAIESPRGYIYRAPATSPTDEQLAAAAADKQPDPSTMAGQEVKPEAKTTKPTEPTPAQSTKPLNDTDAWNAIRIEETGLPVGIQTALKEAGLHTLGQLGAFTASGKQLTDIKGIGKGKAEKTVDALEKFQSVWLKNRQGDKWEEPAAAAAEPAKVEAAEEQPTTEPAKPKGIKLDATKISDHEEHLETCEVILDLIAEAVGQDDYSGKGDSFFDSVEEKVNSIKAWIVEHKHATDEQINALAGMKMGVEGWIR